MAHKEEELVLVCGVVGDGGLICISVKQWTLVGILKNAIAEKLKYEGESTSCSPGEEEQGVAERYGPGC